jgi:membrane-bound lytic murein transglycosylase B
MAITRRHAITAVLAALPAGAGAATQSFDAFLDGVRAEARRAGVSQATLQRALSGLRPIERVLELDRRQPEFTQTWEQYRDARLSQARIEGGRRAYVENRATLEAVQERFKVTPRIVVAIWGLETNYGGFTGNFNELIAALKILDGGHVPPDRMRGSWAGAMGHPQFMPSNFDRLAVDMDGDGRRDIWDNRADALASIAHYFQRNGWRSGEPWGREVLPPPGFDWQGADTETRRPLRDFARMGFRGGDGGPLPGWDIETRIVLPNRGSGQIYLGHHNLGVIRRYNSPVNYGLAVGLLSDRVA